MCGDEPLDVIAPVLAAPLARDRERRLADVGQGPYPIPGGQSSRPTIVRLKTRRPEIFPIWNFSISRRLE
jgi:hypothetical protein